MLISIFFASPSASATAILLIFLLPNTVEGRKNFKALKFRALECQCNARFCSNYTCWMSQRRSSVSMYMSAIEDLPGDLWLKMSISYRSASVQKFRDIFSYDVNICDILGRDSKPNKGINFIRMWLDNFYKSTTMPRSCPIKKGVYFCKNFRPDSNSIPPFLLTGNYRMYSLSYFRQQNNGTFTNTTIFIDIVMK